MERLRVTPEVSKRTIFVIKDRETGIFVAYVPSMPVVVTQAASRDQAVSRIQEGMKQHSDVSKERGLKPLKESRPLILREIAKAILGGNIPQLTTVPDPW